MEKKITVPKRISDFETTQKTFQDLELTINNILEQLSVPAEFTSSEGDEGTTGDTKIIRNTDKSYTFSIKTEDGWKSPSIDNREIRFTDLPKVKKDIKKTISQIEAKDTSTGATIAQKTIFDEKDGKFKVSHLTGVPRPDYDSGWAPLNHQTGADPTLINHNLGLTDIPRHITYYVSDDATPIIGTDLILSDHFTWDNSGVCFEIFDANTIKLWPENSHIGGVYSAGVGPEIQDGWIRVLIWK
jgi:hypothetical protein